MYNYKGVDGLSGNRIPKTELNIWCNITHGNDSALLSIKTSSLYRYALIDDNSLKLFIYDIKDIVNDRIYFNQGCSISTKSLGKCKADNVLYLPVRDDELAKQIFMDNYTHIIDEAKEKIDKCLEKLNIINNTSIIEN